MFNQFTRFGKYGDARVADSTDWVNVVTESITNAPSYDAATTTCKNMITGIQYEILVSQIGYSNNLQKYIVGINANLLQEDFKFPGAATNLPYKVIFTHYTVLPEEIRGGEKLSAKFPPKVSNDIGSQAATPQSSNSDDLF